MCIDLSKFLCKTQCSVLAVVVGLEADRAAYFGSQWQEKQASLSRSALGQTLMVNQLVDMEWKFGGAPQHLTFKVYTVSYDLPALNISIIIRFGSCVSVSLLLCDPLKEPLIQN